MATPEVIPVQVVVNAHDPHALVRFWAEALHYEVEDTTALIERVRDAGVAGEDLFFEADGRLWWNDLVGASAPGGAGPRLLFQRAPEPKEGRNRLHLDLHVGPERRDAEVARLVELGASVLYEVDEPGGHFVTLADPEGNELCVA